MWVALLPEIEPKHPVRLLAGKMVSRIRWRQALYRQETDYRQYWIPDVPRAMFALLILQPPVRPAVSERVPARNPRVIRRRSLQMSPGHPNLRHRWPRRSLHSTPVVQPVLPNPQHPVMSSERSRQVAEHPSPRRSQRVAEESGRKRQMQEKKTFPVAPERPSPLHRRRFGMMEQALHPNLIRQTRCRMPEQYRQNSRRYSPRQDQAAGCHSTPDSAL